MATVIDVTPKALCKRVFDASGGILAVGIKRDENPAVPWCVATRDPEVGQWEQTFEQVRGMFWLLHQSDPPHTFHINTHLVSIVAERRNGWVIFVAVVLGDPIRKSLRRLINKAFRDLTKPPPVKVIPLIPANSR